MLDTCDTVQVSLPAVPCTIRVPFTRLTVGTSRFSNSSTASCSRAVFSVRVAGLPANRLNSERNMVDSPGCLGSVVRLVGVVTRSYTHLIADRSRGGQRSHRFSRTLLRARPPARQQRLRQRQRIDGPEFARPRVGRRRA